jgi:AcrR family transcriptional regulator
MQRMTVSERRAQIMGIAAEEFSRTGLHGTSAETIARRADITQPYIFRLFGTKKKLFLAIVSESFDRIVETFEAAAAGKAGYEALIAMGTRYRGLLEDRTFLPVQLQAFAACDDTDVRAVVQRGYERMWTTVQELSSADDQTTKRFLALGMMLNGMAAMDLEHVHEPWAKAFLTPLSLDEFLGTAGMRTGGG